jgi:hypothetical protein
MIVAEFLSTKENMKEGEVKRASEFLICLFQIDSSGRVSSIDLMSDGKNRDSTYSYLSNLRPELFKDWKSPNVKGKVIIMSVVSRSNGKGPGYIENFVDRRFFNPPSVLSETNKIIVVTPLQYGPPFDEWENPPTQEKRVDKVKKKNYFSQ